MSKKNKVPMTREQEIAASELLGKHVSKKKGIILFITAIIASLLPMLLGIRLWNIIPDIVETGLIGANGEDDSLPKWALVFLIPGVITLTTIICHVQLFLNQKAQKVPPKQIRIFGRWTTTIFSVYFCSYAISSGAGKTVSMQFWIFATVSLLLILLGSHFIDCKKDSVISIRLKFTEKNNDIWDYTHNLVGICMIIAGLCLEMSLMIWDIVPIATMISIVALIVIPIIVSAIKVKNV